MSIYDDYTYQGFTFSIRDSKGRLVPFKETDQNTQGAWSNYYPDYKEMLAKFRQIIDTYLMQKEWFPEENEELDKENKPMNFPYKGYTLEIESKEEDGATRLIGRCIKTGWMLSTLGDYDYLIERYQKDIDGHIQATQKQKEIDELKQKEAREVPDLLKSIDGKLEEMKQEFKKSGLAFNILGNNQEEKVTKVEDRDVILVDSFLTALDNVQKQMSSIVSNKNRDLILDVKLRRVFDWYKDKMEFKSFDSLKDFYFRRQVK